MKSFAEQIALQKITPTRPIERADLLVKYSTKSALSRLRVPEMHINAIYFVGEGHTCLEAAIKFNVSSTTIKAWINKAYNKAMEE